ncbi:MAG TPA: hypothetical protein VFN88_11405, partial [Caulobacteraceae bacterium]|nr:hypothetical protein [Caulobacteraceae bacterium]
DPKYSRARLSLNGAPGGEGGTLRRNKIPSISIHGLPQYFFRADPKGVLEKLSPEVMHNQVSIVAKMLVLMDRLSPEQLHGKAPITAKDLYG